MKKKNIHISRKNTTMKYQKIIIHLINRPNQPSILRTKHWFEINDDSRGTYNTNSKIKFKKSILKSSSCHYNDAYIRVKETLPNTGTATAPNNGRKIIVKNCAPISDCISEISNT